MKLFNIMDLLKIFRMQEPVPKDLLAKNNEIGKYKEVVQEKDVLLRNSKAQVRELEQQIFDLENENRKLEAQIDAPGCRSIINEYEIFFSKIMSDSQEIIQEKTSLMFKLNEMELCSKDILEKYEKSKEVIGQYEQVHKKLKNQILEYEDLINSLTYEYKRLKEYFQNKVREPETYLDKEFKEGLRQKETFKEFVLQKQFYSNQLQKQILEKSCLKSMFEPLKGLDK